MDHNEVTSLSKEEIGARISQAMRLANFEQKVLADRIHVSESALSRLRKAGKGLSVTKLVRLASVLAGHGFLTSNPARLAVWLMGLTSELPLRNEGEGEDTASGVK